MSDECHADIQNINKSDEGLLKNIGLVKRVALHLKSRVPNFMELEELIQVGTVGLIEATKSFDASKGVEFEVFAKSHSRSNLTKFEKCLGTSIGHGKYSRTQ